MQPEPRPRPTKKSAPAPPWKWRLRLRNTASKCILKVPVAVALLAYICMIEEKKFNRVVLKNIPVPYGTSIIPEDAGYKQQPVIIQIITCRY